MTIRLTANRIFKQLLLIILSLVVANVLAFVASRHSSNLLSQGFTALFDLNRETNIPTLYATLTLFICALLLKHIYQANNIKGESSRKHWLFLALLFVFLSIDEFCSIHEVLISKVRETYNLSGFLYYSWIVPYGIAVLIIAVIYLPFFIKLPKRTQIYFLSAAIIFVGGAIGIEALGGMQFELFGSNNLLYFIYYTIEEFLEMLGVAIFIYALLDYIEKHTESKEFTLLVKSNPIEKKRNQSSENS